MPTPSAMPPFSFPVGVAYRLATPADLAAGTDGTVVFLQVDASGSLRVTEPISTLIELRKVFLALVDGLNLDGDAIRQRAIAGITDDLLAQTPSATLTGNPSAAPM